MKKRGFTLIELLVVITVIAILASIGFAAFGGTQSKARDARRKQDLNTIATALELYNQANSHYIISSSQDCSNSDLYSPTSPILTYINGSVPKDPTGTNYCYFSTDSTGKSFRLFAKLDSCNSSEQGTLCSDTAWNYSKTSPDL